MAPSGVTTNGKRKSVSRDDPETSSTPKKAKVSAGDGEARGRGSKDEASKKMGNGDSHAKKQDSRNGVDKGKKFERGWISKRSRIPNC